MLGQFFNTLSVARDITGISNADVPPSEAYGEALVGGFSPFVFSVGEAYVQYPMMARAVSLICGVSSQIIANPRTVVANAKGDKIKKAGGILRLITHSPDDRISAPQRWEDITRDLVLEGNAIIAINRRPSGEVSSLTRLYPYLVQTVRTDDGMLTYRGTTEFGERVVYAERDIIHISWPFRSSITQYLSATSFPQYGFRWSKRPINVIKTNLSIGIQAEKRILAWLDLSLIHI